MATIAYINLPGMIFVWLHLSSKHRHLVIDHSSHKVYPGWSTRLYGLYPVAQHICRLEGHPWVDFVADIRR